MVVLFGPKSSSLVGPWFPALNLTCNARDPVLGDLKHDLYHFEQPGGSATSFFSQVAKAPSNV